MSAVPDPSVLLAYSVACLVLFATPGPDMSLFLSRTVSGGRRHGMAAMLGATAGCCVHTVVAAFGLSALIAASTTAFTALKVAGALYLLWLAIDAVRRGSALTIRRGAAPGSATRTFWLGLGVNLLNPKVVLFFVTFLPQFVSPTDPAATGKLFVLGFWFVLLTTPFAAAMVIGAERVVGFLRARPRVLRGIDFAFAGIFAAFALRIAALPSR